jgi:Uncharacterized conserved protein
MPTELPKPLAAYFAAVNTRDIDAMLAPFAESATVKDEGQERRGRAAIREWIVETTTKYGVTIEVLEVAGMAPNITVTGHVSGNFPGSPIDLRYAFILDGQRIARLEITA